MLTLTCPKDGIRPHLAWVDALPIALALICAWSQPHCAALNSIPVSQGDTWVSLGGGWRTQALALTHVRNGRFADVVVSDQLTHPVAIAAALAHEATEIQEGPPPNGKDCGGYEGYSGQQAFYSWFKSTFGPPVASPGSQDNYVFFVSVPGQQPDRPCV